MADNQYSFGGQLWRDMLPNVINTGIQLGAGAIAKNNNLPYPQQTTAPVIGGGYAPAVNSASDIAAYFGSQTLKKSLGATLKQYWWAVAIPVALLIVMIIQLVKKK